MRRARLPAWALARLPGVSLAGLMCPGAWLAALALAGPVRPEPDPVEAAYQRVLAAPAWRNFVAQLTHLHLRPVDEAALQSACRRALADASVKPAARDDAQGVSLCVAAALRAHDERAGYQSPAERDEQMQQSRRGLVGVGLELRQPAAGTSGIEIVSAIGAGPADRAGLKGGDLIEAIDGEPVGSVTLNEAVRRLRGDVGTRVRLRVLRPGVAAPLEHVLTREAVRVSSVKAALLAPGRVHLRVAQFVERSRGEVITALNQLAAGPDGGTLDTVVLDLRGNVGGLLDAVVGVAAVFLPEGAEVMRLTGPGATARPVLRAMPADYEPRGLLGAQLVPPSLIVGWQSVRLIVLMDARTASGAEAVAAVLHEQRQASLVGQTSFGHGLIEQVMTLGDAGGMRIAVAEMASPGGLRWQGRGITPDLLLAPPPPDARWEYGDLATDLQLKALMDRLDRAAPGVKAP